MAGCTRGTETGTETETDCRAEGTATDMRPHFQPPLRRRQRPHRHLLQGLQCPAPSARPRRFFSVCQTCSRPPALRPTAPRARPRTRARSPLRMPTPSRTSPPPPWGRKKTSVSTKAYRYLTSRGASGDEHENQYLIKWFTKQISNQLLLLSRILATSAAVVSLLLRHLDGDCERRGVVGNLPVQACTSLIAIVCVLQETWAGLVTGHIKTRQQCHSSEPATPGTPTSSTRTPPGKRRV